MTAAVFTPTNPLTLYSHQQTMETICWETIDDHSSSLLGSPTGSGKTLVIADLAGKLADLGLYTRIIVHRQELLLQTERTLMEQTGRTAGIVWKDRREWDQLITIIAQDTFHTAELPENTRTHVNMIDEAHHVMAPTWLISIDRLQADALLGFSATPFRQDKEPLSPVPFRNVHRPVTPQELIDLNILRPAIIETPIVLDSEGQPQAINRAGNIVDIYRRTVEHAIARGRRKIVLYVSGNGDRKPSQVIRDTARELNRSGIAAFGIDQGTSSTRRETNIKRFQRSPDAAVLLNYMALTEGTDIRSIDCVIIGRQSASESTIIQMIGRGLRAYEGKDDCLIFDFTGRPDMTDIIHYWRLDGDEKGGTDEEEREERKRQRMTKAELQELLATFPHHVTPMMGAQLAYPWFQPYATKPLLALPLWPEENEQDTYITVEPLPAGRWRITRISTMRRGPAPVKRRQWTAGNAAEAATEVRKALGSRAPSLNRRAPWRQQAASEQQQKAWLAVNKGEAAPPQGLTAGEASDEIARKRFLNRIQPALL